MIGPVATCVTCALYVPSAADLAGDEVATCKAFPDGIPGQILYGGFDHHKPFPGDHGIQYTPISS